MNLPNGSQYIKGRSIGLFGPERGAARILDILRNYDLKATWFVPTDMMQEHPDVIEMIQKEGHEFAHHGLDHTGRYGETFDQQCERIELSQELFKKYTGDIARGMRPTGMLLPQTERWLYESAGFVYSSAGTSGEGDGWYYVDGVATPGVNVPCRDEQMDDYVQTVLHNYPAVLEGMPRPAGYDLVYRNWVREIEGMIRFGRMGSSAFHPQIAGTAGRSVMLDRFCAYLAENRDVWCSTCLDIAQRFLAAQEETEC